MFISYDGALRTGHQDKTFKGGYPMRVLTGLAVAAMLAAGGQTITTQQAGAASKMSRAHMGHVMTAWKDAPNGMGFLPTAVAEAETAVKHAGLVMKKPDDLEWMKLHTRHVFNALDPAMETKGPGLGFGVISAANGTIKHINIAASTEDASKNVRAHAVHVATSAQNTLVRANQILAIGKKILDASTARDAADHGSELVRLADQLLAGADANSDGKISWSENEGGLNTAAKHMMLMAKGEDIM